MAKTSVTKLRDGWYCTVETTRSSREFGPFKTKGEANNAAKTNRRAAQPAAEPVPITPAQLLLLDQHRPLFNRIDATELELAAAVGELAAAGITQMMMAEQLGGRKQTWFSWMYRLSRIPESLTKYLLANRISTTALVKGVDQLGVEMMERTIKALEMRQPHARIAEYELYDYWLTRIPQPLMKYLHANQISTGALIKGVDQYGAETMERTIRSLLRKQKREDIVARITDRDLDEVLNEE